MKKRYKINWCPRINNQDDHMKKVPSANEEVKSDKIKRKSDKTGVNWETGSDVCNS